MKLWQGNRGKFDLASNQNHVEFSHERNLPDILFRFVNYYVLGVNFIT